MFKLKSTERLKIQNSLFSFTKPSILRDRNTVTTPDDKIIVTFFGLLSAYSKTLKLLLNSPEELKKDV